MPGCAAVGCSNSSEKGFLMKRFPKDPNRRKEWAIRTKRDRWFPTDSSVLCEKHFEPQMWEITREDGSRRLKCNAIPTIFSFTKNKRKQRGMKRETLTDRSVNFLNALPSTSFEDIPISVPEIVVDDALLPTSGESMEVDLVSQNKSKTESVIFTEDIETEHSYANFTFVSVETIISHKQQTQSSVQCSKQSSDSSKCEYTTSALQMAEKEKCNLYKEVLKRKKFFLHKYRNKLRCAKSKIKYLKEKLKHIEDSTKSEELMILNTLFRKDQITALKKLTKNKSTKCIKWSDETMIKGLQLKFHCGTSGYEELLKQNLPFPSIQTLERRFKIVPFSTD